MAMSRGAALLLCGASALMLGCGGDPTGPSTPAAPSALAIRELTTGELVISWTDNSDNESGFQLDRSKGAAGTFSEIASVSADVSTYQDAAVDGASEYCYRVRALGAAGSSASAFSAPACHQFAAPAAPSDLGATASLEQVDLSWTDNSDNETGFEVWRSTAGASGTFALEATVGADVKSFGNTGLQDNAEYCYRVRATGSGGLDSPFTPTACTTTPTPQAPPPAAPSNLAAVPTSPTVIALSWIDNASDETGFEIWRSTTGATGTYSLLSNVVANVTNANDSGLDPVVPYCYEVRAVGAVNAPPSDFTTASCATTPAPPAPNTPSNVSATATSTTDITVTWRDNSSDETGFEIWRSTTGASGTYSFLVSVAANAESTNDTGLTPGTQYCYKVKALGGGVTPSSPLSGSDCATTGAQVAAPSSLAATVTSSTAIALTWTDNSSNESGFEIWRSTTGASGSYTLRNTVVANAESTNDTGLTPGTQYCYEVRGLGNGINPASDFSNSGCATPITVRVVLFGDSNTDRCPDQPSVPGSYVSVVPRLGPTNPHPSCTVAGKVQVKWEAIRSKTIVVVNHAINSTTTGGNTHLTGDPDRTSQGSPNARFSVGGKTRFEAEVLGEGYPWSGGEPTNKYFPTGPLTRVNAFTPGANDFAYVSMGTNDDAGPTRTLTAVQTEANLRWMAEQWIGAGRAPNHFIITTLAPRDSANSSTSIPDRNTRIRTLASDLGLHLIDLSNHVSDDNGATWKSPSLNIGDGTHYTEVVRGWLADQIVAWMDSKSP